MFADRPPCRQCGASKCIPPGQRVHQRPSPPSVQYQGGLKWKSIAFGGADPNLLKFGSVSDEVGVLDEPRTPSTSRNQVTKIVATAVTSFVLPHESSEAYVANPHSSAALTTTTLPGRKVTGIAKTLGAGVFTGGTDVAPGLYDATPGAGQSGNFIVQGEVDQYDEILGGDAIDGGVPESPAAQIQWRPHRDLWSVSGHLHPVSTPYVKMHSPVTLYAGTWKVGQDLGPDAMSPPLALVRAATSSSPRACL